MPIKKFEYLDRNISPDYKKNFRAPLRTSTSEYTASDNLVLWVQQKADGPIDGSNNNHTIAYNELGDDIVVSNDNPYAYPGAKSAALNDVGDDQIEVSDADDLSFGDGTTNSPFSFAMWVKAASWAAGTDTYQTLFMKSGEYRLIRLKGAGAQTVTMQMYNADGVTVNANITWAPTLSDNTWILIVYAYDGTINNSGHGHKLYINGQLESQSGESDGAVAMAASSSDLEFGSRGSGYYDHLVGSFSDILLFNRELSGDEATALYEARLGTANIELLSGRISLPSRAILQIDDCATGSYPTIARYFNPARDSRSGVYPVRYDDTNTIIFADTRTGSLNTLVEYPTVLPSGSIYLMSGRKDKIIPEQNYISGTLKAYAIPRPGISDNLITIPKPGQSIMPFIEDKIFVPGTFHNGTADASPFYTTGSRPEDVGPGFSQTLSNKTCIEINLQPVSTSTFGFGPSTNYFRAYYMNYFNFDNQRFENAGDGFRCGRGTTGSVLLQKQFDESILGFGMAADQITVAKNALRNMCQPITNFGFPSHAKYAATSSFLYPLSGVLDRPFYAEKYVYEFAAKVSGTSAGITDTYYWNKTDSIYSPFAYGTSMHTFFILNQRGPFSGSADIVTNLYEQDNLSGSYESITCRVEIPKRFRVNPNSSSYQVETTRDLVTYGQLFIHPPDSVSFAGIIANSVSGSYPWNWTEYMQSVGAASPTDQTWGRELNLPYETLTGTMLSGSFVMSGTIKQAGKTLGTSPFRSYNFDADAIRMIKPSNNPGGRNTFELTSTGRNMVATRPGVGDSLQRYNVITNNTTDERYTDSNEFRIVNSPYLLLPSDNLIFGWQAPLTLNAGYQSPIYQKLTLGMLRGAGTLKIYGSYVTDNHEYSDGLNQLLTSDAVHEIIGGPNIVPDQFDVSMKQQFSGSFLNTYITGSVSTSVTSRAIVGDLTNRDEIFEGGRTIGSTQKRGYQENIELVDAALSKDPYLAYRKHKSFIRGVQVSSNERFFDSIMPDIPDFVKRSVGEIRFTGPNKFENIEVPDLGDSWLKKSFGAFPYDVDPSTTPRGDAHYFMSASFYLTTATTTTKLLFGVDQKPFRELLFSVGDKIYVDSNDRRTWFGYPIWNTSAGTEAKLAFQDGAIAMRYGIISTEPQFSKAIFRHDKYGQFRDMLEQRVDGKFQDAQGVTPESPVQIQFISADGLQTRPLNTRSSNVSFEATSSVPYFDGLSRNRGPINTEELGTTVVEI